MRQSLQSLSRPAEQSEQPRLVPPARASEMSAPARPPKSKSSSYSNLISEPPQPPQPPQPAQPAQPAPTSTSDSPALGSTEVLVVAGLRTSTPAPLQGPGNTETKESSKSAKLEEKTSKSLENFEKFASGLQQAEEGRRQPKERKFSHNQTDSRPPRPNLPKFISLRNLPSKPIAEFLLRPRSPTPPPPPSMSGPNSLKDDSELPPPPSYSTLKRLSTYRR